MGVGFICEDCSMFSAPVEPLFDMGKVADMGELFIIGGAGGTVGGLMGGDLLSPVSRRLLAAITSTSSGRSRFKLELAEMDGGKDGALGEAVICCLGATPPANMVGKSA